MKAVRLLELSPGELSRRIKNKPLILIPIGTVEWHAAHLPLGVDSLLAQAMAEDISSRTGCVTAPLLTCGICRDLQPESGYFGTLDTIREGTLTGLVADLLLGVAKHGFRQAVFLSGHFEQEHYAAVMQGIHEVPSIQGVFLTAFDFLQDWVQELTDVRLTWPYAGDHAAEFETSLMLAYFPRLVHMNKAPRTVELDMPGLPEYLRVRYPRRASRDYGLKLRRRLIAGGVKAVNELLDSSCTIDG
jgi:creatinine amidohydrolase